MNSEISIIIPTFNEEDNVAELIKQIETTFENVNIKYEIIFVDDHSTDNTLKILESIKMEHSLNLFTKLGDKGKAQSLIEGFSHASYDVIAMIDADLQYLPKYILPMLTLITNDIDIVMSNRLVSDSSLQRRIFSKLYRYIFGKLIHGLDFDIQSGLKVFKKEILEHVKLNPSPWTFDLEFLVKAKKAGYHMQSFDINFYQRIHGESKIDIRAYFELAWGAIRIKLQQNK